MFNQNGAAPGLGLSVGKENANPSSGAFKLNSSLTNGIKGLFSAPTSGVSGGLASGLIGNFNMGNAGGDPSAIQNAQNVTQHGLFGNYGNAPKTAAPAPAIKKVTTEYHAPAPAAQDAGMSGQGQNASPAIRDATSDYSYGPGKPGYGSSDTGAAPSESPIPGNASVPTFPGLIGSLSSSSVNNNQGLANKAQDIAERAGQQISDIGNLGGGLGYLSTNAAPVGAGNQLAVNNAISARQQAVAQGANMALQGNAQALTAQGQAQSGLNSAAGLIPEALRYGNSGLLQNGSTGSGFLDTNVGQALKLVQSGASVNDPEVQKLLSNPISQQAFNQAMQSGGNYNPTALNAASQQNANQGANFQQQAATMDTALKQVDTITPNVIDFLGKSGINSQDNPDFNNALNTYYGKFLSPGNKAIFDQYMGDIKKFTGQILAAGSGTIPTDVSNAIASFDPSNLTVSQLAPYLENLSKLGHNQLSVLQGQSSNSYGGNFGYSGTPSSVSNAPVVAPTVNPSSVTTQNPVIQGLIGGAINEIGSIINFASQIFH